MMKRIVFLMIKFVISIFNRLKLFLLLFVFSVFIVNFISSAYEDWSGRTDSWGSGVSSKIEYFKSKSDVVIKLDDWNMVFDKSWYSDSQMSIHLKPGEDFNLSVDDIDIWSENPSNFTYYNNESWSTEVDSIDINCSSEWMNVNWSIINSSNSMHFSINTDTFSDSSSDYNFIAVYCDWWIVKPNEILPFKEKDSLYVPDEFEEFSLSSSDWDGELNYDDINDNFLKPRPAIQPTFSDILYYQLDVVNSLLNILEEESFLYKDFYWYRFQDNNTYIDYKNWINKFWNYDTKRWFIDAFSWWITLKDIWIWNDLVLSLTSQLDCVLTNWPYSCNNERINIENKYSEDFKFYTLSDINIWFIEDSKFLNNVDSINDYVNQLANYDLRNLWDYNSQWAIFIKELLSYNLWDLRSDQNFRIWYWINIRYNNIKKILENLRQIDELEKSNLLWIYNVYYEYNKFITWAEKWILFIKCSENWTLKEFFDKKTVELDNYQQIDLKGDKVEIIPINQDSIINNFKNTIMESFHSDIIWPNDIDVNIEWWTIDTSNIKSYENMYKLLYWLSKTIKGKNIVWAEYENWDFCFSYGSDNKCFDHFMKLVSFDNIEVELDLNVLKWTEYSKFINFDKWIDRWLVWYYNFEGDANNKAQNYKYDFYSMWPSSDEIFVEYWKLWKWIRLDPEGPKFFMNSLNWLNFKDDFSIWFRFKWINYDTSPVLFWKWDNSWSIKFYKDWEYYHKLTFEWKTNSNTNLNFYVIDKVTGYRSCINLNNCYFRYHVFVTYKSSPWIIKLYVNWDLKWDNDSASSDILNWKNWQDDMDVKINNNSIQKIWLWYYDNWFSNTFNWVIDELYIYDRVLNEDEIWEIYDR